MQYFYELLPSSYNTFIMGELFAASTVLMFISFLILLGSVCIKCSIL